MSEYGDYSQKIFNQSERNSLRAQSQYSGEYINFNANYSFGMSRIINQQYQNYYYQQKQPNKDTDCTVKDQQIIQKSINLQRKIRKIEISSKMKNQYLKVRKGSAYQTMELNINFKTIFCKLIRQLANLKLLTKDEKELFIRYKSQSPSFRSLNKFLSCESNQQSKSKLKKLMESSHIISSIQNSDLKLENKIVMMKFIQVMRLTILKENKNQKWK